MGAKKRSTWPISEGQAAMERSMFWGSLRSCDGGVWICARLAAVRGGTGLIRVGRGRTPTAGTYGANTRVGGRRCIRMPSWDSVRRRDTDCYPRAVGMSRMYCMFQWNIQWNIQCTLIAAISVRCCPVCVIRSETLIQVKGDSTTVQGGVF